MTSHKDPEFQFVQPRATVEIHLLGGQVICGPRGACIGDFLKILNGSGLPPIIGAIVNGELRELTYPIKMDAKVRPVTMGEADGMRIYRRSLTFLLEIAFSNKFPGALVTIDHSVASGGYYCQVSGRPSLSAAELTSLAEHMRALVAADMPFRRQEMPLQDAIDLFRQRGYDDKVRLLAHRQKDYVTLYELAGHLDYHHGYMAPSTGYLRWFELVATGEGFTLRFPRRHAPTVLLPMPEYPNLAQYFPRVWRLVGSPGYIQRGRSE